MAYTKILVIHNRLDKSVAYARNPEKTSLEATIDYARNRDKTERTCFETAINCGIDRAYQDMMNTKLRWDKTARARKGYHIIQSFPPGEVLPEEAHALGVELAQRLLGDRYEVVVTTHLDKAHLHNHLVFNSVSFLDGKMYQDKFKDYFGEDGIGIRGTSDAICREHGLSVIEPDPRNFRVDRAEWEARRRGKPNFRDMLYQDIDNALRRAFTFRGFLRELRRMGYEVKTGPNVAHTAVKPPGGKKFLRLDSLKQKPGYTEADIHARLSAARSGETPPPASPAPSLLTPGCRYHVQNGLLRQRPRRPRGFQALYLKYLYLLRGIRRGRPHVRTAFSMRQELLKFDRYQRQFLYLRHNRLETAEQLATQYDALQAEIDALTDRRRDLYNIRRSGHGGEAVTGEITNITSRLRALRRDLKLCARIEGDIPRIRAAVQTGGQDRSKTHEKTDQSRPARHIGADAGLPADRPREH